MFSHGGCNLEIVEHAGDFLCALGTVCLNGVHFLVLHEQVIARHCHQVAHQLLLLHFDLDLAAHSLHFIEDGLKWVLLLIVISIEKLVHVECEVGLYFGVELVEVVILVWVLALCSFEDVTENNKQPILV